MNLFKEACFAIALVAVLIAFFVYPLLPAIVPTHWNASGIADGYGPAWVGAFLLPLMIAFVLLVLVVVPKIAVFKNNFRAFEKQYWMLGYALLLFFLLFYAITLLPNFGYCFNFSQILSLPMAMLFISIGVLLPAFKRNFFVGIRTPWTLASDNIWKKTHVFAGKAFILAGLAMLLAIPFPRAAIWVGVGAILVAAAASVLYSFLLFRKGGKVKL